MTDPAPVEGAAPLPRPPAHPTRLAYFGTPEMAVPPLRALHAAGFEVAVVVTRTDKRRGRRGEPEPSPVKVAAVELGVPVVHDPDDALDHGADLGVVVAYGRILRRPLLERLPLVNLHFSLLPRWRGAAPVERAILAGDERTGVCVMAVEETLDTGDVYARRDVAIAPTTTAIELATQLTAIGAELMVDALRSGLAEPEPQSGDTTYAEKLTSEGRRIDWHTSATQIDRQVRVGGAWTMCQGTRLKVLAATPVGPPAATVSLVTPSSDSGAELVERDPGELVGDLVVTGDGVLRLETVQPEGKGPIAAADWLRGARFADGVRLGDEATS